MTEPVKKRIVPNTDHNLKIAMYRKGWDGPPVLVPIVAWEIRESMDERWPRPSALPIPAQDQSGAEARMGCLEYRDCHPCEGKKRAVMGYGIYDAATGWVVTDYGNCPNLEEYKQMVIDLEDEANEIAEKAASFPTASHTKKF